MFTGIVETTGEVRSIEKHNDLSRIAILSNMKLNNLKIGDSISINGVCLTVAELKNDNLYFDIISETLEKSNLSALSISDYVNIERAMKIDDRINGHLVQGHVEGVSRIISKKDTENETKLTIELNDELLNNCIYKGSICIDGISLTIAKIKDNMIDVAIIPHTLNNTTLKYKKENDLLNIETDMISKYVSKKINQINIK